MDEPTIRPGRNPGVGCPTRAKDLTYARIQHWSGTFHTRYERLADDACWLWAGYVGPIGYGRYNGKNAHRIAWVLSTRNDITDGDTVDHLCFERRCVNPRHLQRVSLGENVRRARERQHGGIFTREERLARKREQMARYRAKLRGAA